MIGVDIVKICRIAHLIDKFGNKFLQRVFTTHEIESSKKYQDQEMKNKHFAKRFAAKEAYFKALGGSSSSTQLQFNFIGVQNNEKGKPYLFFNGKKLHNTDVSLSDDGSYAIAAVIKFSQSY